MPGVGERLKWERESRDKTIEEIADASGIGRAYLEALENDAFRALPGPAFGKLYIRAYAELLGFDPQPFIDDYDRERRAALESSPEPPAPAPIRPRRVEAALAEWRDARMRERTAPESEVATVEAQPEEPAEVTDLDHAVVPAEGAPAPAPPSPRSLPAAVVVGIGLLAVAGVITFALFPKGTKAIAPATVVTAAPPRVEGAPPPPSAPVPPAEPIVKPTAPGSLTVPEFGVGRRVVNLRLEGAADAFPQGSRVSFASRVLGGRRGDVVRHVWLWNGKVQQSIPLRLGGPDWRTHSAKLILRSGDWAVEARDDAGGVLARASFTCVQASP